MSGRSEKYSKEANLNLRDLGSIGYESFRGLQKSLVLDRLQGNIIDTWVFCEHLPVITLGRRSGDDNRREAELLASTGGIPVLEVSRGGTMSIHLPGMLMVYPVYSLREKKLGVKSFVSSVLDCIAETLSDCLKASSADQKLDFYTSLEEPGVWVDGVGLGALKIASAGLRIDRGVTDHGFAVNLTNSLELIQNSKPCGIEGSNYTSLARLMDLKEDDKSQEIAKFKAGLVQKLALI